MKPSHVCSLFALVCSTAVSAESYVIGVEKLAFAPHYSIDAQGQYQGFARELFDLFAQTSGVELSYKVLPVEQLLPALLSGQVDFKYPDSETWAQEQKAGKALSYSQGVVEYVDGVLVAPQRHGQPIEQIKRLAMVNGWTPWGYQERIDAGQMQVGSLIAFLAYFMQILMAVLMATLILVMLPRAAVCAERITEVLSTQSAITSPAVPQQPAGGVRGVVALDGVSFRYPGAERPVLEDISFTAAPGTTTAIVGGTGSGKSTLVALICRSYDVTAGTVRVDGVDVRDYDPEQLWAELGLVPQRGYLFSGTVADNLRIGKQDATESQMWAALRVAAADDFVAAHPDGLDMRVAQGGINFSGGQRQRLAIARAVIRQPAIYLFDDAFSALDARTDARVRTNLRDVSASSTVIVVAQRISTVIHADQIIVVDGGRVVGTGRHDALLADCPAYAEFVDSQSVGAGVGGRP